MSATTDIDPKGRLLMPALLVELLVVRDKLFWPVQPVLQFILSFYMQREAPSGGTALLVFSALRYNLPVGPIHQLLSLENPPQGSRLYFKQGLLT
jgi:hypothetical protein